jgi:hypothetical protein
MAYRIKVTVNMTEEESAVVLASIAIARLSAIYLFTNFETWRFELQGGCGMGRVNWGAINWKFVAIMDVVAAVFFGTVAIGLWMLPAIGWLGWGIGVIASAVIVSGATALIQGIVNPSPRVPLFLKFVMSNPKVK